MNIEKINTLKNLIKDLHDVGAADTVVDTALDLLLAELDSEKQGENTPAAPYEDLVADVRGRFNEETYEDLVKTVAPTKESKPRAKKEVKKEAPKSLFESTEQESEIEVSDLPPAPTHDELQAICMEIVRADRTKRDPLKELIRSYGAEFLTEVPVEKLGQLYAKLEDLR